MSRASLAALLMMASLPLQAKVNDKCIVLLEARPANVDPLTPKLPCPVVVGYTKPSRTPVDLRPVVRPLAHA